MKKSHLSAGRRLAVVSSAVFAAVCVVLCASCAAHVSKAASGTIRLSLGGFRGLETGWPSGQVPAFSTVKVTVSADDMDTVTKTITDGSANITLEIPAGSDRLVLVEALPAAGGGAPDFALGYSGSATVDLEEGKTTTAAITLALSKTQILLPDVPMMYLYSADSLTGTKSSMGYYNYYSEYSDFEFDQYGRVYMLGMSGFNRNADLEMTGHDSITPGNYGDYGLAFAPSQNRLYFFYYTDFYELQYADISQAEPVSVWVNHPSEVMYFQPVVAVDENGSVYACSFEEVAGQERVVKLNIGAESAGYADATQVLSVPYSNIGLTSAGTALTVQDLTVKDGVLYVVATDIAYVAGYSYSGISAFHSRGKLVAIDTATMTKKWECGWSGDSDNFPTDPDTQFYGPKRFVGIAPKKLYVADDGFTVAGSYGNQTEVNQNRVVEVDLDAKAISGSGLQDASEFFIQYDFQFVC